MSSPDPDLDLDDAGAPDRGRGTALERIQQVSRELSLAARRARMSARAHRSSSGGFQARRGARLMRWVFLLSFALIVVAPSLTGAAYFGFIASDQYVSVADFTVSGGEAPAPDGLGALTGIPALAVVQDTQIVTNYVHSRPAVDRLETAAKIRELYSDPNADWIARFDNEKPIEKFVKYWQSMSSMTIKMPAGIVELQVRAFRAEDARRIAAATLSICEDLVNDMNERINHDAVATAEQELQRAAKRLAEVSAALEKARYDSGLLDAGKTAESLQKLITETKSGLLVMQQQYDTQLRYVLASAPQMAALRSRIEVTQKQIAELEAKLTSTRGASGADPTLSAAMTRFGELDLEREIADRIYAGATASLELARMNAERKMMYLKTFVAPAAAQEPLYPKRALSIVLIAIGSLALWGALCGLAVTVRNHMA